MAQQSSESKEVMAAVYRVLHDLHHAGNLGVILPKQFGALFKQETKLPRSATLTTGNLARYDGKSGGLRSWSKAVVPTQDELDALLGQSRLLRDGECIYAPEAQKYCPTHPPNQPIPHTSTSSSGRATSPHGHFSHVALAPPFRAIYNPQIPLPPGCVKLQAQQQPELVTMEIRNKLACTEHHVSKDGSPPLPAFPTTKSITPIFGTAEATILATYGTDTADTICAVDNSDCVTSSPEGKPFPKAVTPEQTPVPEIEDLEAVSRHAATFDASSAPSPAGSQKRGRDASNRYCISPQKKMSRSSSPEIDE